MSIHPVRSSSFSLDDVSSIASGGEETPPTEINGESPLDYLPQIDTSPLEGKITSLVETTRCPSCFTRAKVHPHTNLKLDIYDEEYSLPCLLKKPLFRKGFKPLEFYDYSSQDTRVVYLSRQDLEEHFDILPSSEVKLSARALRDAILLKKAKLLQAEFTKNLPGFILAGSASLSLELAKKISLFLEENKSFLSASSPKSFSPDGLKEVRFQIMEGNALFIYFKKKAFPNRKTHPLSIESGGKKTPRLIFSLPHFTPFARASIITQSSKEASHIIRIAEALQGAQGIVNIVNVHVTPYRPEKFLSSPSKVVTISQLYNQRSLHTVLESPSTLPLLTFIDRLKIAQDVLQGVRSLHRANILHRDLKTENVFLHFHHTPEEGKRWSAVIGDLDDVIFADEEDLKTQFRGSSMTLSPEIARALIVSPKTHNTALPSRILTQFTKHVTDKEDIWGAGLILFDLFYPVFKKRCNWDASSIYVTAAKKPLKTSDLQRAVTMRAGYRKHPLEKPPATDAIATITWNMLQPNPSDRPSAEEIYNDFCDAYLLLS